MLNTIIAKAKKCFLWNPKFDVHLNKDLILEKYNLNKSEKYAVLFYPRKRDLGKIQLEKIYSVVSEIGYKLLVKTRGKDLILNKKHMGDHLFVDDSWFPHTGMELIEISDIVINFGSTVVEESVMLNTPIIEFDIKPPERKYFYQLYDFNYAKVLNANASKDLIKESIMILTNRKELRHDFKRARDKYLYKNSYLSSYNILNIIFPNNND